ncbi:MAG: glycosyltransferase family 4 protein [Planctomycetota bacterium]
MDGQWVIVTGDFNRKGGMDRANYYFAWHLAETFGERVHVVAHSCDEALSRHPRVTYHHVARPWGKHLFGGLLLERAGRRIAARLTQENPQTRVVVNGGNCDWPDINWAHFVHHPAPRLTPLGSWLRRQVKAWAHDRDIATERRSFQHARVIIANSEKSKQDILGIGIDRAKIHVVYYGNDSHEFGLTTADERTKARHRWGIAESERLAIFVGTLGIGAKKGLDTLLNACGKLPASWRVLAAGGGPVAYWQGEVDRLGLTSRVRLLGHTTEIAQVMAAADVLVSPTRFEPYGLAVHEALCRGLPAIVSRGAGVAERYPAELADLLLHDPNDAVELAGKMAAFDDRRAEFLAATRVFGEELRNWTWKETTAAIVEVARQYALR